MRRNMTRMKLNLAIGLCLFYLTVALSAADTATAEPLQVAAGGLTLHFDPDGRIRDCAVTGAQWAPGLSAGTSLEGCKPAGAPQVARLATGGLEFTRTLTNAVGRSCVVTDRFTPSETGIRWQVEIVSSGPPWTAPLVTWLNCNEPQQSLFWCAWADPECSTDMAKRDPKFETLRQQGKVSNVTAGAWRSPLEMMPFVNRTWTYGNTKRDCPTGNDFISVPLITLSALNQDAGLSLALSPEDTLLDMAFAVTEAGQIKIARSCHRLGGGKTVRLSMDLVAHEAGWRGGLRWMTKRYPLFFDASHALASELAGCGAYSGNENPVDVAKLKKMGFRLNWKLSDDFAYMGMFIPPVRNADEHWTRSCAEPRPPGKPDWTSGRILNDYAKYMRQNGFYVLNYFNATEYGKDMQDQPVPAARANDPGLWKDPLAFLTLRMPHAWMTGVQEGAPHDGKPFLSNCYGAVIVDPGDPDYLNFLLEQASRYNRLVPDSAGICIDRLDWLRFYNPNADDGVSWVNGQSARSLYLSWKSLMDKLGPLMHRADKVIFANTMVMRLELNRHLDGIYNEYGQQGGALNASALMGLRKPVLGWTWNDTLQPDADVFFQQRLFLGIFPIAPYPNNNHCITNEPWADQQYLDYGSLLDAMRGKKWVLEPHCVEAITAGVSVNLFEVSAGGYALPVVALGSGAKTATVRVRNLPNLGQLRAEALYPGAGASSPLAVKIQDGALELQVPLQRGCAMVKLMSTISK